MKLNPKQKLKKNWKNLQETGGKIKQKLTGPVKAKADEWMGKWIHKQIATFFIWDEHVQGWVFGAKKCPNCYKLNRRKFDKCQNCDTYLGDSKDVKGINELAEEDMEKSIERSKELKSYIMYKANQNRKYKKKLDEVGEKIKNKEEELKKKFNEMKEGKFLKYLKGD